MTEENIFYQLGKRDAVAEILMMARTYNGDTNRVIKELAQQLPDNPHAKWVMEELV